MSEIKQMQALLDGAGIEHLVLNGIFLCSGPNDNLARISTYEDDDSQFQVKLDGLTPAQAFAALNAAIKEED